MCSITKHRSHQRKEQWGKIVAFLHCMDLFLAHIEIISFQSGEKEKKKEEREKEACKFVS